MKICMLTSFFLPTIGGVESHVYNLSKELIKKGHQVIIVHTILHESKEKCEKMEIDGIELHRVFIKSPDIKMRLSFEKTVSIESYLNGFIRKVRSVFYSKRIAAYIEKIDKKREIEIIHQHDFISNLFTTKILKKKYHIVLTNHTGEFLFLNKFLLLKFALKILLQHLDCLIGPSKELCKIPFQGNMKKIKYIPNGVDINKFVPVEEEERHQLRLNERYDKNEKIILCARRWAPTKGVIYFVKAIKKISRNFKNVKFIISGNEYEGYPEYKNSILKYIEKERLRDYIVLLGDIPHQDMYRYYQISDIVVLPSLMEATSLAGLEAMSCGKPLIGSNVGGIPEIIEDGKTGCLVEAKNEDALACAILRLLKNPQIINLMGKNSREKVEKEFSWNIVADKTIEVYQEVKRNNEYRSPKE